MESNSFDERAARIADLGDVRVPLNMQPALSKSRKEKRDLEGADVEKVREADADMKRVPENEDDDSHQDAEEMDKKPDEVPEINKSIYAVETGTLQRALLLKKSRKPNKALQEIGKWASTALKKSAADVVSKAVKTVLEKGSLVNGVAAPEGRALSSVYSRIVGINSEIAMIQDKLSCEAMEPGEAMDMNNRLKVLHEYLASLILQSQGLGLKTQDMIRTAPQHQDISFKSPAN
jgi:hypothetical protein